MVETFVVVLSMGFALGYFYAKRRNDKASVLQRQGASHDGPVQGASHDGPVQPDRVIVPMRCEYCTDVVNPNIFPYKRCSGCGATPSYHHGRCCPVKKYKEGMTANRECFCRSVATQSQCTYTRKRLTPRFRELPEFASGVSDVSFSHTD